VSVFFFRDGYGRRELSIARWCVCKQCVLFVFSVSGVRGVAFFICASFCDFWRTPAEYVPLAEVFRFFFLAGVGGAAGSCRASAASTRLSLKSRRRVSLDILFIGIRTL